MRKPFPSVKRLYRNRHTAMLRRRRLMQWRNRMETVVAHVASIEAKGGVERKRHLTDRLAGG